MKMKVVGKTKKKERALFFWWFGMIMQLCFFSLCSCSEKTSFRFSIFFFFLLLILTNIALFLLFICAYLYVCQRENRKENRSMRAFKKFKTFYVDVVVVVVFILFMKKVIGKNPITTMDHR